HLSHSVLSVGRYAFPPSSVQKVGSTPLRDCLNDASCATTFLLGAPDPHAPNPEYKLDSNDTRMQQVVYANGKLWGALDTAIKVDGKVQSGIEWFAVRRSSMEATSGSRRNTSGRRARSAATWRRLSAAATARARRWATGTRASPACTRLRATSAESG